MLGGWRMPEARGVLPTRENVWQTIPNRLSAGARSRLRRPVHQDLSGNGTRKEQLLDTPNATSTDDNLSIDWGTADVDDGPAPDLVLTLPPDLFGPGDPDLEPVDEAPAGARAEELLPADLFGPPDPGPEPVGEAAAAAQAEEPSTYVLDDLFPGSPELAPAPAGDGAPLMVEDLFATATAPPVTTPPEPKAKSRLAPERPEPARERWKPPRLGNRKLWLSAAVVAGVVALSTVLNQPPDPSIDVRSAAQPDPAPTVTASTRPLPSTTVAPGTTTVPSDPSTTTAGEAGAVVTTVAQATTAAPRATVAPTPATTAAPPRTAPPTSTATTEPEPVTTEPPPPDTTATTRRPRETVPPPTSSPSTTSTTVEPEETIEVD